MKPIRLHIILLMLILSFSARAQQDPQLSQQFFSRINFNPAATDVSDFANAYLIARQQWIGFEGAPSTQMFNAQGYIADIRSSVGLSIMNDRIGNNGFFNMMLSYGYHVKVGEERYLALGISAGMVSRKFGGDLITGMPEIDPEILEMLAGRSVFRPDVNLGLTFMAPKFSFGFSATHLTRYVMKDDDWFKPPLHLYAFMDFGLDFNENVRLIPRIQAVSAMNWAAALPADSTLATKFMDKMDIALDFGATLFVKDKFWIGASFRSGLPFAGTSLSAMVGINVAPNVRVGYSYDYKLGNTFQNIKTYGSHEIMLNYRMRISETEMSENTPRFFD